MHNNNSTVIHKRYWVSLSAVALALTACSQQADVDAPLANSNCVAEQTISQIQGNSDSSPLVGQSVSISGVVTASWQGDGELGGFFLQDKDAGLFVQATGPTVAIGDQVRVNGVVSEAQQLTQLDQVTEIIDCGRAELPAAKKLTLPVASVKTFEQLEGQYVSIPQTLIVNGNYLLDRHGSFDVAAERLYTPTQVTQPGASARQLAASYELQRLVIDDNRAPNPSQVPFPAPQLSADNSLRAGDSVRNVQGILSEFNGRYRIQPTAELQFTATNPRPPAPSKSADPRVIRVATFNVLNYFNGNGVAQSFPTDRGAETAADFSRQEAKIIAAMVALKADIIGLMEIENDGYADHSAIVRLVEQLKQASGQPWQFVAAAEGQFGGASITNGLIYRSDRVEAVGAVSTVTEGVFRNRSRYPLIQRMRPLHSQETFVVAVNHFKSKGSCPRDSSDPNANQNDGQACWNAARVESAERLIAALQQPLLAKTSAQIVLGDFNAYAQEDPMQTFYAASYHNRAEHFEPKGYSYVFNAQAGSLDHLLVSDALHGRVIKQQHWLINADEPSALSYEGYSQNADWYAPDAYRSSDHDPIIADIQF
ncbi:ExeM/NucH family extracellular endonuclease [Pseudidiomarina sp. YC-516-91]|uniref:ExeM/NucH family extracellular endonuclease n=1 Tax=Pseudidiomarina salilacus TaxID=3384452 RepID=UPI003984C26A